MLFDQISNDIKEAMKARDKVRLEALRNIKKVFIEAKTAPGANDTLEDDAALKILQKLVKQDRTLPHSILRRTVQTSQKQRWHRSMSSVLISLSR